MRQFSFSSGATSPYRGKWRQSMGVGSLLSVALAPVQFWEVTPLPIGNFPTENLLCDILS